MPVQVIVILFHLTLQAVVVKNNVEFYSIFPNYLYPSF